MGPSDKIVIFLGGLLDGWAACLEWRTLTVCDKPKKEQGLKQGGF